MKEKFNKNCKNENKISKKKKGILIGGGGLVGFVGGFFGGGGGMLAVPLLNKIVKLETKKSHASAMMIILPMSIAAAIIYIIKGYIEFSPTLYSSIGVLIGGIIGALLLKKLKSFVVAIIFALCMIGIGIKLIFF
ncbi:MAG: TSUP family transporter [Firmicutes bacterium]|nr:TSUP family transporter [Bacillota bacterium]